MILVVGSMNLDRIARLPVAPGPGETVAIDTLSLAPGGKGGNVAAAAARLGARVTMVGRVGRDADGDFLLSSLAGAGVDTGACEATDEAPTGTALIWVEQSGENRIGVFAGANATLRPEVVDTILAQVRLVRGADRVVVNLEIPMDTVTYTVRRAHAHAASVLLNLSPVGPFPVQALGPDDVLVVNGPEAGHVLGAPAPAALADARRMAQALRERGPGTVVVTMGGEGVAAASATDSPCVDAVPVRPVDTTGAGDAFLGALAAGLDAGLALEDALRLAAATGAFTATRPGAQTAQPTWEELSAWARARSLALPDLAAPRGRAGS